MEVLTLAFSCRCSLFSCDATDLVKSHGGLGGLTLMYGVVLTVGSMIIVGGIMPPFSLYPPTQWTVSSLYVRSCVFPFPLERRVHMQLSFLSLLAILRAGLGAGWFSSSVFLP